MHVIRPNVPPGTVKLDTIKQGDTFRLPAHKNCETVWMVTANQSSHPDRVTKVRTVSLVAGSVAYKSPNADVVPVSGKFVVDDWGHG